MKMTAQYLSDLARWAEEHKSKISPFLPVEEPRWIDQCKYRFPVAKKRDRKLSRIYTMKKIILFAFGLLSIIFMLSMLKHKTARAIMDTMECYPHV